jgi:tetratricopeptide (TPR) repeat protein
MLILIAGVLVSVRFAVRANRETRRAETEAQKQEAVNAFLNDMLSSASPQNITATNNVKGTGVTLRELLDEAVRQLDAGKFKDRPEIEAAVRTTIGNTYRSVKPEAAEGQLRIALALIRQVHGPEHPEVAKAMVRLADALRASQPAAGEAMAQAALDMQYRLVGHEHPDLAATLEVLGKFWLSDGRMRDAEVALRRSLELRIKFFGEENRSVIAYSSLANVLEKEGKLADAEWATRRAIELGHQFLGDDHPGFISDRRRLAGILDKDRKYVDAAAIHSQIAAAIQRGEGETNSLAAEIALEGDEYKNGGELDKARTCYVEALAIRRKLNPEESVVVGWSLGNLEGLYRLEGKTADLKALWDESLAIRQKNLQAAQDPQARALLYLNLCTFLMHAERADQAKECANKALSLKCSDAGALNSLSWEFATAARPTWRDPVLAVKLAERAVELAPQDGSTRNTLGVARYYTADFKGAVADLEKAVQLGNGGTNRPEWRRQKQWGQLRSPGGAARARRSPRRRRRCRRRLHHRTGPR